MRDAPGAAEQNVECRTALAFRVEEAALRPLLPPGWAPAAAAQGPSRGANLNVILAERLLVQDGEGAPLPGQATNQLAVVAVPVRPAGGYPGGVLVAAGLSAQAAGAPGPYGVFAPAEVEVERALRRPDADAPRSTERWSFAGGGLRLELRLSYARGVPARSRIETVAYSAKDPNFHRTYSADQGADVLRSVPDRIDRVGDFAFTASGGGDGALTQVLAGLSQSRPLSVVSLPWTVRRAVVAPAAALLGLQSLDPTDFTLAYVARAQTMWADAPYQPGENGIVERGGRVWLDKALPPEARGTCRVRLADGRLRYLADAARLVRDDGDGEPARSG